MKKLFLKIENILNEELSIINQKIKGTTFLEILKFNILDKLSEELNNFSIDDNSETKLQFDYEDEYKKITSELIYHKLPSQSKNIKLNQNLLLICMHENIKVDILDVVTKKNSKINLNSSNGITFPCNSSFDLEFMKNCLLLQIYLEDKNLVVEN